MSVVRSAVARLLVLGLLAAAVAVFPSPVAEACHTHEHAKALEGLGEHIPPEVMAKLASIPTDFSTIPTAPLGATPCVDGMADVYPCSNVDLLAHVPLGSMGGGSGSALWGWTDPVTGVEWAIMGRSSGTSFISLEDPTNPVYVGNLPSQTLTSSWRELKAFGNHAYIVSDNNGSHGIQVFDLTQLRDVVNPPVTFSTATDLTALYTGVTRTHTITINEDTGFAYANGSNTCSGGLHMVDVSDPANPTFAGCFSADGYTHDVQCVVYEGPDLEHVGDEICFASNTDTLTIVDVTDKSAPAQLSRTSYAGVGYVHQGWLTPDQRYFLLDDELDEDPAPRRTYVWDLLDLEAPLMLGAYTATGPRAPAIDHNQFILGDYVYQANYRAGLSVLHIDDPATASLTEVGFFDTYPESNSANFSGAWHNYPFFASGIVIVSDINRGLFVLQFNPPQTPLIFEDGFESGDAGAWSGVVP